MREADFDPFLEMLDEVAGLLNRGKPLTPGYKAMFFRAVADHPIEDLRAAFDAHVKDPERGHFMPTPANILAQLAARTEQDGRPGADEAWATAIRSADESETVVWTEETSMAWTIARPVFDRGDEIGARMAFRDAYNRMVASARDRGVAVSWHVSEGFDPARRVLALERAAKSGQLPQIEVEAMLQIAGPAPVNGLGDLLSRPDVPEHTRQAIERFKQRVADKANAPGIDGAEKERTRALKADAAKKVDDYTGGSNG